MPTPRERPPPQPQQHQQLQPPHPPPGASPPPRAHLQPPPLPMSAYMSAPPPHQPPPRLHAHSGLELTTYRPHWPCCSLAHRTRVASLPSARQALREGSTMDSSLHSLATWQAPSEGDGPYMDRTPPPHHPDPCSSLLTARGRSIHCVLLPSHCPWPITVRQVLFTIWSERPPMPNSRIRGADPCLDPPTACLQPACPPAEPRLDPPTTG